MNVIICIDKNGGMMFNDRRLSRDEEVVSKIIEIISGGKLFLSEYSYPLFSEYENAISSKDFLEIAKEGDFCFIEDGEIPADKVESVYIFNWNRDYPADKFFKFSLDGFKRKKKEDFAGNSHKKITLEIYGRV